MSETAFSFKIYWRRVGNLYHAFTRYKGPAGLRWYSLCYDSSGTPNWNLSRSGGQKVTRPPAVQRCPQCDIQEMKVRNREESLPVSR